MFQSAKWIGRTENNATKTVESVEEELWELLQVLSGQHEMPGVSQGSKRSPLAEKPGEKDCGTRRG